MTTNGAIPTAWWRWLSWSEDKVGKKFKNLTKEACWSRLLLGVVFKKVVSTEVASVVAIGVVLPGCARIESKRHCVANRIILS